MKKSIGRMSTLGKWFAYLGVTVIAIGAMALAYAMFFDTTGLKDFFDDNFVTGQAIAALPVSARMMVYVLAVAQLLPAVAGFVTAVTLFSSFGKGRVFTRELAKRVEIIGWSITTLPLVQGVLGIGVSAILAFYSTTGRLEVSLDCDEGDLMAIIFGLLFVVLGRIMHEAVILSEENRQFV